MQQLLPSLRFRILLLWSLVLTVLLSSWSVLLFWEFQKDLFAPVQREIDFEMDRFTSFVPFIARSSVTLDEYQQKLEDLKNIMTREGFLLLAWNNRGESVLANIPDIFEKRPVLSRQVRDGNEYLVLYDTTEYGSFLLARHIQPLVDAEKRFRSMLFLLTALSFILMLFVAGLLESVASRPFVLLTRHIRAQTQQKYALAPLMKYRETQSLAAAFDHFESYESELADKKRLFLQNMNHDIRTPLTVISTTCDVLETSDISEKTQHKLTLIRHATKRIRDLLESLISLDALTQQRENPVTLNVRQLLEPLIQSFDLMAGKKGLQLTLTCPSSAFVTVPRSALLTCLENLIKNAIVYTDTGAVSIEYQPDRRQFLVSDTGIGISDVAALHLFER